MARGQTLKARGVGMARGGERGEENGVIEGVSASHFVGSGTVDMTCFVWECVGLFYRSLCLVFCFLFLLFCVWLVGC